MDKVNEFLLWVESAAASVGLHINEGKTKCMTLNMEDWSSDLLSRSRSVECPTSTEGYLEIQIFLKSLKIRLLIAACESVLLYGSETWTLTKAQEKSLVGHTQRCYCVWCWISHASWKDKVSNINLYGSLLRLSNKLRRRFKVAGHCIRHPELLASEPMHVEYIKADQDKATCLCYCN